MSLQLKDSAALRKARGAFFTPPAIAEFLSEWAIQSADATVLDPTCGESVFLLSAAERLAQLGASSESIADQLAGVDIHGPSLDASADLLRELGTGARLVLSDFFELPTPAQIGDCVGWCDAVIGNPPFVRYQEHRGETRKRAAAAALAQGVRLSGLASSWAATLVHAAAFLKPEGRLAMVLPAELLTVGYAEPIRRWLRKRFGVVNLVLFEHLQFHGADEQVVLLVASGRGPADSFSLFTVDDADDLAELHPLDSVAARPAAEGKWSDLVLPLDMRQLLKTYLDRTVQLETYGSVELGTVTGANHYFTMSEITRRKWKIDEKHLKRVSPPGTKHLASLTFSRAQWEELKIAGQRVWLLHPEKSARSAALQRYLEYGIEEGVEQAYKCTVRDPWWRPPVVPVPELFFTYMSHRFPRLINNTSGATLLNSMHGVRLAEDVPAETRAALPLLMLNSATMLGAEVMGRSYGGGVLKMEPREAALLPMLSRGDLMEAWKRLAPKAPNLDAALKRGEWWVVNAEIDRVVLKDTLSFSNDEVTAIRDAATLLRVRRTRQTETHGSVTETKA